MENQGTYIWRVYVRADYLFISPAMEHELMRVSLALKASNVIAQIRSLRFPEGIALPRDSSDGVKVTCSEATAENDHQIWILTRVSRIGSEIKDILESWKSGIASRTIQPHASETEYIVIPHEVRRSLWDSTKLLRQPVRPGVFDYNDFVIKAKDALRKLN
ncbi:hypothetical protein FRC01_003323 [Tulasnella sp. 417]|nr:hypothetical protein FRC01_003323 [Tulasnella sp. 417]